MKTEITIPELGLVALTRAFLGAGVAFVLADRLDSNQRRAVGWTLTGVGVLTTIPLALEILSKRRLSPPPRALHSGAADEYIDDGDDYAGEDADNLDDLAEAQGVEEEGINPRPGDRP